MAIEYTAERYCDDVLSGKQVACRWVRLACERHRRDSEHGADRGLWFDEATAKRAVAFFPAILRHSKGRWARQPVHLEPWQQFLLWQMFGWKRENGKRRFRTVYVEVARKNGKSTMAAGIGLYLVQADGEPGAEVYTAATKIEQARIIHLESIRMVGQSPLLKKELRVLKNNINNPLTFSKYEPLGANSETLDGLNVHAALVDELHAHPNRELWDVLETATGSREQPVMFAITTAGFNQQSFCFRTHDYAEKVLDGTFEDDAFLGVIYSLDRDPITQEMDDWEDEAGWVKANPNLGVSKFLDVMQDKARTAKREPEALNSFLTKELNVWTTASARAISPERWKLCNWGEVELETLRGRPCWGGVDLSSTLDVTAEVLVFDADGLDGVRPVLCRFWVPEDNIYERVKRDRVPYDVWAKAGHISLTPGNVIDDAYILAQIRKDLNDFDVRELAYDPWNATWLANQLQADGYESLVAFRQGVISMNPAISQLEKAIARRAINHQGNPVLAWMASNLVVTQDPAGNKKPDKAKSTERIDGMVALVMALYRAILDVDPDSVYESRGVLEL